MNVKVLVILCSVGWGLCENVTEDGGVVLQVGEEEQKDFVPDSVEAVEKRLKNMVEGLIKMALPHVIRNAAAVHLSERCMGAIFRVVVGLQQLSDWAVAMLDATGKPPAGILTGTMMALGNYDQCLDITVFKLDFMRRETEKELFYGQYCMLEVKLPEVLVNASKEYYYNYDNRSQHPLGKTKTFLKYLGKLGAGVDYAAFRIGVCVPSLCSQGDLQEVAALGTRKLGFPMNVLRCESRGPQILRAHHKVIISLVAALIGCVLVGTFYDAVLRLQTDVVRNVDYLRDQNKMVRFVLSFSVYTNTKLLVKVREEEKSEEDREMAPVRGLLLITVVFNILASTYAIYHPLNFLKYSNFSNFQKLLDGFSFASMMNATAGTEHYFFSLGLFITYLRWRNKDRPRINIKELIARPFLRMTSAQLLLICLFMLSSLLGSGPIWNEFMEIPVENCRSRWWTNILYVVNLWESPDACLYHTWLLSVVMQFSVLSIFILWFLIRWPVIGILINVLLIIGGALAVGALIVIKKLPGAFAVYLLDTRTGPLQWNLVFIQAYDHVGPFCIGVLSGYFLAKYKDCIKLRKIWVVLGWAASAGCILAVLSGLYEYRHGDQPLPNSLVAVLYGITSRNVYTLGVAWAMVACITGYGGFLNQILSWKGFIPFYRVSFMVYLLHLPIMYYFNAIMRERMYMNQEEHVMKFFSYTMMTFLGGFLIFVTCQAPYLYVESLVFPQRKQEEKPQNNQEKKAPPCVVTNSSYI